MKESLAKLLQILSIFILILSTVLLWKGIEPFKTHYFLFAWWSYIALLDSWLYLHGGESLMIANFSNFFLFLLPFSTFFWFIFEAFNLRIQNWSYLNMPKEIWIRWPSTFLAYASVVPGIFLTANSLDHLNIFKKNEFSQFFNLEISKFLLIFLMLTGGFMLILPLIFPAYFFPLIWGGFILLLDPLLIHWQKKSLIREWVQRNWNRTFQLLLAGAVCGFLWELWNFWAGAKWIYTIPLPDFLASQNKIFEMPLIGFLGFPPFALECFVMTEFAQALKELLSKKIWRVLVVLGFLFSLTTCYFMDLYTILSFR
ncbi:MAG: hypothetical protein A3I11_05185 [Elusimicrobia bacterium RIFCSPLOWO2_02_FULL_39_32]|nr:MAG: hypothetical protein A2034_07650 [Elusimicrobia bacterium GWA2_38_7]OGR80059.1 MAG: hypothetical protein A3B80_00420 [Elusimicrobia bacterium RIFCSPHIGHO2_02_FULL_39_36]OGR91145.1 MAG: hypothetical protein A3I11_05185 [Elusimicrobia bacterium RIFCSPLOWO2_02_FULL_39_32]OGS00113.1 MAG: hypothetical protein A3G85_08150 [Elusimicrobia bacterium RIFCSPLOWO2_12_FULL_39_28]